MKDGGSGRRHGTAITACCGKLKRVEAELHDILDHVDQEKVIDAAYRRWYLCRAGSSGHNALLMGIPLEVFHGKALRP